MNLDSYFLNYYQNEIDRKPAESEKDDDNDHHLDHLLKKFEMSDCTTSLPKYFFSSPALYVQFIVQLFTPELLALLLQGAIKRYYLPPIDLCVYTATAVLSRVESINN